MWKLSLKPNESQNKPSFSHLGDLYKCDQNKAIIFEDAAGFQIVIAHLLLPPSVWLKWL